MKITCEKECLLGELLTLHSPQSSKTSIRSWVKEGRVTIDGNVAKRVDTPVSQGQLVQLGAKPAFFGPGIPILYEDRHLVVIEKPAGLLSVATNFQHQNTAHALLKRHYHPNKVHVVHRLDQETSGVMLFGLSEKGYEGLKQLFESHEIERRYCAILEGQLENCEGTWQSYVYEDSQYKVHSSSRPQDGSLAVTHYFLENKTLTYSRVHLRLETGRKNQIRVHCKEGGHPVVGDAKYGAVTNPIKRLCLHAEYIEFKHPISQKIMRFSSKTPAEFDRLVKPLKNDA